jgi:hypothetical protein
MRTPSIIRLLAIPALLASSLALAACGDDPSIVASWRELPNALAEEQPAIADRTVWTFGDDGVLTMKEGEDTSTGTYTIDGERLTLTVQDGPPDDQETLVMESDVVVTDDRLLYGALFPAGEVDGPVGTWKASTSINGRPINSTLTVVAAHTTTYHQVVGTEPATDLTGTWAQSGDSLMFTYQFDANTTATMRAHLLGEEAMGLLMEKI